MSRIHHLLKWDDSSMRKLCRYVFMMSVTIILAARASNYISTLSDQPAENETCCC